MQLKSFINEQGIIKKINSEQKQDLQTIEIDVGEKQTQSLLTLRVSNKILTCTILDKKSLFDNVDFYNAIIL